MSETRIEAKPYQQLIDWLTGIPQERPGAVVGRHIRQAITNGVRGAPAARVTMVIDTAAADDLAQNAADQGDQNVITAQYAAEISRLVSTYKEGK